MAMAPNDNFASMRRQTRAWIVGLLLLACGLGTVFMLSGWSAVRSLLGVVGLVFLVGIPTLFFVEVWFLAHMIPARPELTPALGEPIPEPIQTAIRMKRSCWRPPSRRFSVSWSGS